eukprot:jgi/Picsp_1/4705/NSC_02074-R1_protein
MAIPKTIIRANTYIVIEKKLSRVLDPVGQTMVVGSHEVGSAPGPGPRSTAPEDMGKHGQFIHIGGDIEPSSRLIVKNLPKYADESRLREFFGSHGEVTDTKVLRTRDGRSRCFGFVGFASPSQAAAAKKYYDKAYMDAMRIQVEFAQKFGSESKQNAWSKYTEGTSRYRTRMGAAKSMETGPSPGTKTGRHLPVTPADEDDPKLQEFLSLMQPRHKQAVWSNEDGIKDEGSIPSKKSHGPVEDKHVPNDDSDEELYKELQHDDDDEEWDKEQSTGEEGAVEPLVIDTTVSDMDYLQSRINAHFSEDEDGDDKEDESGRLEDSAPERKPENDTATRNEEPPKPLQADQKAGHKDPGPRNAHEENGELHRDPSPLEMIRQTCRLFVRNLPYSASDEDLRAAMEEHGKIEEVHIVLDPLTRRSKGYALVRCGSPEDAVRVYDYLDGSIFMGRLLHLLPGKPSPDQEKKDVQQEHPPQVQMNSSSYKREKEQKLQQNASNMAAWNSLFMRADTVADAVAEHLKVPKSELLDPSAPDMAVRLALGEVKIISMTKEYLEQNGVDVSRLKSAGTSTGNPKDTRSDVALIVKNLPYSVDEEEVKALFLEFGPLSRWILPPTRGLAIVEYLSSQDAGKAFKRLAFKRYRSVPIYLEWAPKNVFASRALSRGGLQPDGGREAAREGSTLAQTSQVQGPSASALKSLEVDEGLESSTVFVKNISFKTSRDALERHVLQAGQGPGTIKSTKIAERKGKGGTMLSSGYGFVECSSEDIARQIIGKLQGSLLDGHRLVLQLARSGDKGNKSKKGQALQGASMVRPASKLVVRNVAFEAKRYDIIDLFSPFGEIKSCRIPRKIDGQHRGFAFVEFASTQEAKAAMEAVAGSHLYGRRLVLEWAEQDDGLEQIREKTARRFGRQTEDHPSQRKKAKT